MNIWFGYSTRPHKICYRFNNLKNWHIHDIKFHIHINSLRTIDKTFSEKDEIKILEYSSLMKK